MLKIEQVDKVEHCQFNGFEGPEKLLELWFLPEPIDGPGLFAVQLDEWKEMLQLVHCEILNIIKNDQVVSYLLSESSFFVYKHKLVLKTCGTTTLLHALPKILELADKYLGSKEIYRVFYSRKSFMFPEKQLYPHSDWDSEVKYLDTYFENGAPYKIGRTNGEHWYLYVNTNSKQGEKGNDENNENNEHHLTHDFTVELLMTELDIDHSKIFFMDSQESGIKGGNFVAKEIGLDKIYDNIIADPFLFEPCGFSMNALSKEHYFNVHVTPESHCSYASFESNIPLIGNDHDFQLKLLIENVLNCFKPKQFSITLFKEGSPTLLNLPKINNFKKLDSVLYDIDGYSLRYAHFKIKN